MRATKILRSLNAPNTLPVPLPPASGLLAKGKGFVKLYKTGIVNVWKNRGLSSELLHKYNATNGNALATEIVEVANLQRIRKEAAERANLDESQSLDNVESLTEGLAIQRNEYLTVLRTSRDWPKLPGFAVVFAVCFELTPILLLLFPRIAPSTCWSPSFEQKLQTKYGTNLRELAGFQADFSLSIHRLEGDALRALARTVLPISPAFSHLPLPWVRRRLGEHVMRVRADDALLRRSQEDLVELSDPELLRACMARAIPLDGGRGKQLLALEQWLTDFVEPADAGAFLGPPKYEQYK